ncbi:ABC transporter permease [Polaromonas sp.]|uniref:ABC transporter permease n=1 Tax=Polaromonas sp. TaxID=1869339 RepID=UPI0013BE89A1|nr:ABC transporter permease [Polaromonas sp.]NDP63244.1 ABC transporter permease [Polaromonas sp.]
MKARFLNLLDGAYPLIPTRHRYLITQLARRDVLARYKGSVLGLGWGLLFPLLILLSYTFVFRTVFKARWPGGSDSTEEFALQVFTGLVVFNLFSDLLNRAPRLVLEQPNLVKRVVFPLEILSWVAMGNAMFHAVLGLFILLLGVATVGPGLTPWTLLAPLVIMSCVPFLLGMAWLLSGLGVFIRDISHFMGPALTMLMFMSPVLYPVSSLPKGFAGLLWLNPLTVPIENLRYLLLKGQEPNWSALAIYTVAGIVFAALAYQFFVRVRPAFSDEV